MEHPAFQPSLFDGAPVGLAPTFAGLRRIALDARSWVDPIVALVALGEPRRFLLRPKGGGPSLAFSLGRGDLLVTGGGATRGWEHCVPKTARAGPRISVAFRHGLDPRAYAGERTEPGSAAAAGAGDASPSPPDRRPP